jgi:predicted dehydrogenase
MVWAEGTGGGSIHTAAHNGDSRKLGVGVIGTGFGASVHLPAFAGRDDVRVVGVCSAQRERARRSASAYGVPFATDDYRELIHREDVDIVDITAPPPWHAEMASAAFEAGKHVLCEKPLAMNASEARHMLEAARASGMTHAVNHEKRYMPGPQLMRRLVRDGCLGSLRLVAVAEQVGHGTDPTKEPFYWGWIASRSQGGGFLMSHLSHQIDTVRFCFGDVRDVSGRTSTIITERPVLATEYRDGDHLDAQSPTVGMHPVDVEDTVGLLGSFCGGGLLSVHGSWSLHFPNGPTIEAYGDAGSLFALPDGTIAHARVGEQELHRVVPRTVPVPRGTSPLVPYVAALMDELVAVIGGVVPDDPVLPTFEDGLELLRIVDAVLGGSEDAGAPPLRQKEEAS